MSHSSTHTERHLGDDSFTAHRLRARIFAVLAVMAALLGVGLATASPASAVGYSISYSVRNDTNETLTFVSAHGPGNNCNIRQFNDQKCFGAEESARVSPAVVKPGQAIGLYSEIDIFGFFEKNNVRVTYQIGSRPNDQVVLTIGNEARYPSCKIQGTRDFVCERIPVGQRRDFILTPA
jgi:hypothetical protein